MGTELHRVPSVLSEEDLAAFRRGGFVRVEQAFPRELALALQDEVWRELGEEFGIERDDRGTWRVPPHSPRRAKQHPLNEALAGERFVGAISDLLGRDDWRRPPTWGGFLVSFPDASGARWDVPADGWHWDGPPDGGGLLVFSFFSSVRAGGGGTLLLSGSQRLIASFYASLSPEERARPHRVHRKLFARWDPWLEQLTGRSKQPLEDRVATFLERTTEVRGVPCRVVELCGEPGDVVLCNPGLLHSSSPNRSDEPRVMRVKFLLMQEP